MSSESVRGDLSAAEESDIAHGMHTARERTIPEAIESQQRKNATPMEMWERFITLADCPEASLMKLHEDQSHGGKGGGLKGCDVYRRGAYMTGPKGGSRPGKRLIGLSPQMAAYLDGVGLDGVDADQVSMMRRASGRSGAGDDGEMSRRLRKRLAQERPKCAEAVEMVLVQNMSQREAGVILGISHVAVRKRLLAGLALLMGWATEVSTS